MLRFTLLGKRMRALSDDLDLAETAGIDTARVILYTWIFAGGLAGLAGVLAGAITQLQPELGFALLLPIFAAVVLGGIGDAFGALAGGIVLGLVTEWSTLFIDGALEARGRLRRPDPRADHPPAGHLRQGEGDLDARLRLAPCRSRSTASRSPTSASGSASGPRRHLRALRARAAAQRRLHRDHQLRPGRVHGDRRATRWRS